MCSLYLYCNIVNIDVRESKEGVMHVERRVPRVRARIIELYPQHQNRHRNHLHLLRINKDWQCGAMV